MGRKLLSGVQDAVDSQASDLEIRINSPGGRVDYMIAIFMAIRSAEHRGVKTRCVVEPDGMAASAAAVILQACTTRVMSKNSIILFHSGSTGGVEGKRGDLHRAADNLEDNDTWVASLVAWRLNMTASEYMTWTDGRDRWLDWDAAKKRHAVDVVE